MNPEEFQHYQMQNQLSQGQLDSQASPYAPNLLDQSQQGQAILVAETDPKKIVQSIILRLQGLELTDEGKKIKISEPKMNKIGIENIHFILSSQINQNIILSHLDREDITKMMRVLGDDLVDDLSMNWQEYGIQKKTDLDTIVDSCLMNVFVCLKRAEGQGEKNWLSKVTTEIMRSGDALQMPKKEGFLSKFRLGG